MFFQVDICKLEVLSPSEIPLSHKEDHYYYNTKFYLCYSVLFHGIPGRGYINNVSFYYLVIAYISQECSVNYHICLLKNICKTQNPIYQNA